MPTKYVCLDDEASTVKPFIQLLEKANPALKIEIRPPLQFDEEIRRMGDTAINGLLIDLRLDRTVNEEGNRVNYRALSLAQELRTRMTEKEIKSFPIILWSIDDYFKQSYDMDDTSHDLFDRQYYKAKITENKAAIAAEMLSLSIGYNKISSFKSKTVNSIYSRIIDLENAFEILDDRIPGDTAENRSYPAHVFARSVLQNLVFGSGPLVDEHVLAARLGVDIAKSADWQKLTSKFASEASYTGVFSEAWPRWWMHKISAAWAEIEPNLSLQRLEAKERVEILKKALKLPKLTPAKPLSKEYDQRFWHVCKLLKAPIAPTDAVQLSVDRSAWQDGVYASMKAVLERQHKSKGFEIHAFERARIDDLVAGLSDAQK